jgi:hypothetical protein
MKSSAVSCQLSVVSRPSERLALSPLGESDFQTPMGSIGPQKSGRVARRRRFLEPRRAVASAEGGPQAGEGVETLYLAPQRNTE